MQKPDKHANLKKHGTAYETPPSIDISLQHTKNSGTPQIHQRIKNNQSGQPKTTNQ